jgi:hypothetical protein
LLLWCLNMHPLLDTTLPLCFSVVPTSTKFRSRTYLRAKLKRAIKEGSSEQRGICSILVPYQSNANILVTEINGERYFRLHTLLTLKHLFWNCYSTSNERDKTPFPLQKRGLNSSPDHIPTFWLEVNNGWP